MPPIYNHKLTFVIQEVLGGTLNDKGKPLSPWMKDSELFAPTPDRGDRVTMGEFVLSLVTQPQYHGSLLPRIPLTTKRNMMLKVCSRCGGPVCVPAFTARSCR